MTTWTVSPAPVGSAEALELLRDYFVDVSDRYFQHNFGRDSTPEEIETGLADFPSDHLDVFLIGRVDGVPTGCAGLVLAAPDTVELTRMFVRHEWRGTGGGTALLAAIDAAVRQLGAEQVVLDTRLDLVEARALYLKHGYVETAPRNERRYAEVWYRKDLTAGAA